MGDDDDVICKIKKSRELHLSAELRELIEPFPKLNTCNKLWKCNRRRAATSLCWSRAFRCYWQSRPTLDSFGVVLYLNIHTESWPFNFTLSLTAFFVIRLSAVEILNSNLDNQKLLATRTVHILTHIVLRFSMEKVKMGWKKSARNCATSCTSSTTCYNTMERALHSCTSGILNQHRNSLSLRLKLLAC